MTLSIKPGVEFNQVHPALVTAIPTIMQVFTSNNLAATITSGNEGQHGPNSLHKVLPCRALDWRTWADDAGTQIDPGLKASLCLDLRAVLGRNFDVVQEATHIHIEYDPKD